MKATTDNDKIIISRTLKDIRKRMKAMLKPEGPRSLTAHTDSGAVIHVEIGEGEDYIQTRDGRIIR